ncbi:hypothetical protein [Desulfurobacterium sp.]|uniref:hypothetical protein n=1 Tax=Desulfurobacterium sp. TaxID=2004706 RepID=UPI0026340655|nr:hypothetical protein [Desulfurobacterium sp.]
MEKKREGIVLVTVLGVIAVLSVAGGIAGYVITKETKGTRTTKDAQQALLAAEAGAQRAISRIKWEGNFSAFSGSLGNSGYNVSVVYNQTTGKGEIIATGAFNSASRRVVVNFWTSGAFSSFAAKDNFTMDYLSMDEPFPDITSFRTGGQFKTSPGNSLEFNGMAYNATFISKSPTLGENVTLKPFTGGASVPFVPSVTDTVFNSGTCDYTDVTRVQGDKVYFSNGTSLTFTDITGDGTVVLCNTNGGIESNGISYTGDPVVVYAKDDIDITGSQGHRFRGGETEVTYVSLDGDIKVDEQIRLGCGCWRRSGNRTAGLIALNGDVELNAPIDIRGKGYDYNVLIYAGGNITGSPSNSTLRRGGHGGCMGNALINVMEKNCGSWGSSNVTNGNIMIAAKGAIDLGDWNVLSLSHKGGRGGSISENINLLLWSNGDMNLGSLDLEVSSRGGHGRRWLAENGNLVTLGILTGGKLNVGDLILSGAVAGISEEEIDKWIALLSNGTAATDDPELYLLEQFADQLQNNVGKYDLIIGNWKYY